VSCVEHDLALKLNNILIPNIDLQTYISSFTKHKFYFGLEDSEARYAPPPDRSFYREERPGSPIPPPLTASTTTTSSTKDNLPTSNKNISVKRRNWVPAYSVPTKSQFQPGPNQSPLYRLKVNNNII
jgi:hypothetical protein